MFELAWKIIEPNGNQYLLLLHVLLWKNHLNKYLLEVLYKGIVYFRELKHNLSVFICKY